MTKKTKPKDTTQTPDNVGDVGETNKRLNQQGEQPRSKTAPDDKPGSSQ